MDFEVLGDISDIETFATGKSIRELRRVYGAVAETKGDRSRPFVRRNRLHR